MSNKGPFPTEPELFPSDPRICYSAETSTYKLRAADGSEWEWVPKAGKWMPTTDEAEIERQRSVYKVEGVDDDEAPAGRKRKAVSAEENDGEAKKPKAAEREKVNKAIYVTGLPDDVDANEVFEEFSKSGLIARSLDTDEPRIKLYYDDEGRFKGEALIVFFRPESIPLAIQRFDDTDFRLGQPAAKGKMRVTMADQSYKAHKDPAADVKTAPVKRSKDKQRVIDKTKEMNSRLADWSDEDDNPSAMPTSSRWDKVVVLRHMFTLEEMEQDAEFLSELKEDLMEECGKLGKVANVTVFDKEEDGVVTVRFSKAEAAQACVELMHGRWYDKRQIQATIADGTERFQKTWKDKGSADERLEAFTRGLE
ncbi:hypothetical protein K470DRAFT_283607 [Piedraia hortae CBS 480.64]|uniref:RRM domain-containing protein n=1 Tax=Piedraia hortae CBS 480.64 TaxID=1314780 RepID=A0A6A7BRI8_9PEZI|nr:hypothetical protein K470DRAFT_283607 [Piedraia hortae CBS 480.64]